MLALDVGIAQFGDGLLCAQGEQHLAVIRTLADADAGADIVVRWRRRSPWLPWVIRRRSR
jgi:hypothetical protein